MLLKPTPPGPAHTLAQTLTGLGDQFADRAARNRYLAPILLLLQTYFTSLALILDRLIADWQAGILPEPPPARAPRPAVVNQRPLTRDHAAASRPRRPMAPPVAPRHLPPTRTPSAHRTRCTAPARAANLPDRAFPITRAPSSPVASPGAKKSFQGAAPNCV